MTIVPNLKILIVALGAAVLLPATAYSAAPAPAPVKCRKALVNPVTGSAYCVDPRGAPVAPPPHADYKACKHRAHDTEAGTVYERYSGCW